jgi:hypothetical protein
MAASIMANKNEYSDNNIHVAKANAFISANPKLMEEWYNYNASMNDPLIPQLLNNIGCKCIPRCTFICNKPTR